MKQLQEELRSISAICVTPFDEDGGIDYFALEKNLSFLVENGLDVVVPCGNTGEFFSLSYDECLDVIEFTCRHLRGNATVVAGVSFDLDLRDGRSLGSVLLRHGRQRFHFGPCQRGT